MKDKEIYWAGQPQLRNPGRVVWGKTPMEAHLKWLESPYHNYMFPVLPDINSSKEDRDRLGRYFFDKEE